MVKSAASAKINTLLVQVRGRGDAYFNDGLEPRAGALAGQAESFDPLGSVLKLAHAQGIRVHAWVNVSLVSSAVDLPASRAHVIYRHPDWLMVPKSLARELSLLDSSSQIYLEKLTRWTRLQAAEIEGLYASPIPEESVDSTVAIITDLVTRYPVDGVHLDYVRYPNDDFDYSRAALELFRTDVMTSLDAAERRRRERSLGNDLVAWTEAFP